MTEDTASLDHFEDDGSRPGLEARMVVDIEGYEGPLDVLLVLARNQKVDLRRISILELAEQYLVFVHEAQRLRLELAADYLVMAAWLAYLKSRLLLPSDPDDEEPSGEEMAARLAFQLQRLEAMREAGARLMSRDLLGRDVFQSGQPEGVRVIRSPVYEASLFELLQAYAFQRSRRTIESLHIGPRPVYTLEAALVRLNALIGTAVSWESLESFLPPETKGGELYRSAVASTFAASLELARQRKLELRQLAPFGPLYVRSVSDE